VLTYYGLANNSKTLENLDYKKIPIECDNQSAMNITKNPI